MSGDVLAERLRFSGDLPERVTVEFTEDQLRAIERRDGDLLLDASAGSGKTSVLVERFVRTVLEDGIDVGAILTITFTDKAAAELRERIRVRLRELGAVEQARATEGAFISTIHGFCARVLRAHALAAGIDPRFVVLDELDSAELQNQAFDQALAEVADTELLASYKPGPLRGAVVGTYHELRSRGQTEPALPPLPAPTRARDEARGALLAAAGEAARELGAIPEPSKRVLDALQRLERVAEVTAAADPWPGDLDRLGLPRGNGAALSTAVCEAYTDALQQFRTVCEVARAGRVHALLDRMVRTFAARYAERKRARSALDFEDLELVARGLLLRDRELRDRYANRFEQIMVDEFQDTNNVQLELIEALARDNLFVVGDGQQSIYGFRHADVELFERIGERLSATGRRATLQTNFRSRPEILEVINRAFEAELGDRFRPVRAGRPSDHPGGPLVELLIVDKGEEWATAPDFVGSAWRIAEARALAGRIRELLSEGASPQQIVVLTRATTDLRAYERALEEQGIPTYLIGGRGYWSHPQVMDIVAYLRALANPRDEQAFYELLASPLVGVSTDALVLVAAAARANGRDPWWALRAGDGLEQLAAADRGRLDEFVGWFAFERTSVGRIGIEALIERAVSRTGYDLKTVALAGGERRLANVRKLMRLGREYEQGAGADLRGFLNVVEIRAAGWLRDPRESEAPVEGEALDAVRLMTIHRAKGLEFEIVAVADLGRDPWRSTPLLRVADDGRLGMRLGRPGSGRLVSALAYDALGKERMEAEADEERRIFYVAMTRAKERLILSGAAKLPDGEQLPQLSTQGPGAPIGWISRALAAAGVEPAVIRITPERSVPAGSDRSSGEPVAEPGREPLAALVEPLAPPPSEPPPPTLSYTALSAYARCGYRFYLERVLRLPPAERVATSSGSRERSGELSAAERGVLVHALLERLDFRRPARPTSVLIASVAEQLGLPAAPEEVADLVETFAASPLRERLAAASDVRREESFAFLTAGGILITGVLDVVAAEPDDRMLVIDYKSDRLDDADPAAIVEAEYGVQRLIYALAALRAGAQQVEVVHVFLERPEEPVTAVFAAAERPQLEARLTELAAGVQERRFPVSDQPCLALCNGCPGEGGLCSWPLAMTRREAVDQLF